MATGILQPKATYTTASGTYTTATWAQGTRTVTWTAPANGIYIVWMQYKLTDEAAANRNSYKQLQMLGTATNLLHNNLYYDSAVTSNGAFVGRTISQPVLANQGQTIYPYVHTDIAGIVYNVRIIAVKIA